MSCGGAMPSDSFLVQRQHGLAIGTLLLILLLQDICLQLLGAHCHVGVVQVVATALHTAHSGAIENIL